MNRLPGAREGEIEARSKVGEGTVRSMEGDLLGVVSGGKKTSWDLFNLRRKVGEVGEAGSVDLRRPDLRRPPGLFDMADGTVLRLGAHQSLDFCARGSASYLHTHSSSLLVFMSGTSGRRSIVVSRSMVLTFRETMRQGALWTWQSSKEGSSERSEVEKARYGCVHRAQRLDTGEHISKQVD